MDTMLKAIRTLHIKQKNWKQELYRFLRQYRATPHSTTAVAPVDALNNRYFRTQLPQLPANNAPSFPNTESKIKQNDELGKQRMKHYADKTRNAAPTHIAKGDTVLVRQRSFNKLMPYFNPQPFTVESRNGNIVTETRGSVHITRNVTFFKRINLINTPINDDNTCEDWDNVQLCR